MKPTLIRTRGRQPLQTSEAVAIGSQVFDLLLLLVRNRDRVVSKDDLLDAVWDGRHCFGIDGRQPYQRRPQSDRR